MDASHQPLNATRKPIHRPVGPTGNWQSLVGKKIEAVVTRDRTTAGPPNSVYLLFTDGTTFEIFSFGGTLGGTSQLYPGSLAEVLSTPDPGDDLRVFGKVPS